MVTEKIKVGMLCIDKGVFVLERSLKEKHQGKAVEKGKRFQDQSWC